MIVKLYPENPQPQVLKQIISVLQDGGLIIYPTDTVYAIGCDALDNKAVERICQYKGINPKKSNLSIMCSDISMASEYTKMSNTAFKLLKRNIPGPFTFILPASNELPKVFKNRKEVGVRIPDNRITQIIIEHLGNPLLTTSVNFDEEQPEYSTNPELIQEFYGSVVDLIVDGGIGGREVSTVISCLEEPFSILRQGIGMLRE